MEQEYYNPEDLYPEFYTNEPQPIQETILEQPVYEPETEYVAPVVEEPFVEQAPVPYHPEKHYEDPNYNEWYEREPNVNVKKRQAIKKGFKVVLGTVIGLLSIRTVMADVFLGQRTQTPTHIWRSAAYNGSIARDGSGYIQTITKVKPKGNEVVTINRDGDNLIASTESVYDGTTVTTTYSRTGGRISSWTVS